MENRSTAKNAWGPRSARLELLRQSGQLAPRGLASACCAIRRPRWSFAENERRLETHARRLRRRPRAGRNLAVGHTAQLEFDLIDAGPEHGGVTRRMPHGRDRRAPSLAIDAIGAAVADDAVATPEPAVGEMNDTGALAQRRPEPGGVCPILEHGGILARQG